MDLQRASNEVWRKKARRLERLRCKAFGLGLRCDSLADPLEGYARSSRLAPGQNRRNAWIANSLSQH